MITAKVIASTLAFTKGTANRIDTLQLTYPRFIHAELMTHRMFSRNAASSRAIPVATLLESLAREPVVPSSWGRNQAGMAAHQVFSEAEAETLEGIWRDAAKSAVDSATKLMQAGVHKQVANRLLEPFTHMTSVVTATEWDNFLSQRLALHPDGTPMAQPEMYLLACEVKKALDGAIPRTSRMHLPYLTDVEQADGWVTAAEKCLVSAARCARVSTLRQDKKTWAEDIGLAIRLVTNGHMSPLEHPAVAGSDPHQFWGNFCGWRSLRKFYKGESVWTGDAVLDEVALDAAAR